MYRGHTVYRNKYVIKTLKRKLSVRQVMAMGRINVCVCVCSHRVTFGKKCLLFRRGDIKSKCDLMYLCWVYVSDDDNRML